MAGCSTGQKTPEGIERALKARLEGLRRWRERKRVELAASGGKFSCGRKRGDAWITPKMRERAAAEAKRLGYGLPPDAPRALIQKLSGLVTEREWRERRERHKQNLTQFTMEAR
jgi:hypothetical protein